MTIGKGKMATQYHFLVSCKKITDTEWTMEMQADSGEVPMSIVHPDSETDEVLTPNPITQTIPEAKVMTHYLRQLNRRSGRGTVGHNDSVIRNISQRLSQLQLGQQITVKISCFEHRRLRSGLYEINSLGVFPPVNRARPLIAPLSQEQKARVPQAVVDAITSLGHHVETLQQELYATQRLLREYGMQLEAQEQQLQQLTVENNQLRESGASQTTPTQSSDPQSQEAPVSQSATPAEEADEDHIDTEAQSLFQQFMKASKSSKPQNKPSVNHPSKNRDKDS